MLPPIPPNAGHGMGRFAPLSAMLTRVMRRYARMSTLEGMARWIGVTAAGVVVAGCLIGRPAVEQRSNQGPTAKQMMESRVTAQTGREPTFEEKRQWDVEMEQKIDAYLREHPDKANSVDVSTFRFMRQVTVGMDKQQVMILLGPPLTVSLDQDQMQKVARGYWPAIKGNATEVWVYPMGWNMFFAGPRLIDITQYLPSS